MFIQLTTRYNNKITVNFNKVLYYKQLEQVNLYNEKTIIEMEDKRTLYVLEDAKTINNLIGAR